MSRKWAAVFVGIPVLTFVAYVLARACLDNRWQRFIYAENGPIELGTAVLFACAGVLALSLARKARDTAPAAIRVLYGLFALASVLVMLEEISYGQQLFGWRSPEWFERNNHHGQTNLHNLLDNKPSHVLKNVANYGTLVGLVFVPAAAMMRRASYRPGHWTYYLLPRAELIAVAAIAQICSFLWEAPKSMLGLYWHQGWNELRELYWGMAALGYVVIVWQRLTNSQDARAVTQEPTKSLRLPERLRPAA